MDVEQVIIVGAGPAGLAAAIQLKRYGLHPLVFERAEAGGLLLNANLVENYPGFPAGIPGPELVELFIRQANHLDVAVTFDEIIELDYHQGWFRASTRQNSYTSRAAVIATGTKPVTFADIAIPDELKGRVFYEVYPLLNEEGKCISIVGSGDAAFDYGLNLSRKNRVVILNRGDAPKCLSLLWDRALKVAAITYFGSTALLQLEACPGGRIRLNCQSPDGVLQLDADYLVGAIGREPCLDCLSDALLQKTQELEGEGVLHLIGDVKNGIYRQTSIAVGDGIRAAMKICRQLKEKR